MQCPIPIGELGDLDGLIGGDIVKHLGRPAGWPVDFQNRDPVGLGQADGLLEWVCPPTAARGYVPVDRQRVIASRDDLDPGADGRPIGLLADELHGQPVVPLTGVLEEHVMVSIAFRYATHFDENIDVAVAVPVGARHAMPFLKAAGAR